MSSRSWILLRATAVAWAAGAAATLASEGQTAATALDVAAIRAAAGAEPTVMPDGVVRLSWPRTDVPVIVDGVSLAPPAGLASWAALAPAGSGAMLMGDTVVFEDEVDAAIDAAFAHGLEVTALHNHFFFDRPRVFFLHLGGSGSPAQLAAATRAVWEAIRSVRRGAPAPAERFAAGPGAAAGSLDAEALEGIIGHPVPLQGGVAKATIARTTSMHGTTVGGSMGVTTWAAFSGSDSAAAISGDFAMTAEEVQPVLRALRRAGIHIVALHQHMIGEAPTLYFTHFWAQGPAQQLARGFRAALDAQSASARPVH